MKLQASQKLKENKAIRDTQPQDPLDDMRNGRWGRFVTGAMEIPNYLEDGIQEDEK